MDNKQVYIICAGGHAKQVIDVFIETKYDILGAYDDNKIGSFYRNIPIIGKLSDLKEVKTDIPFFCTVGDNSVRQYIYTNNQHLKWINCISNHAYISPTVKIGTGNYIGVHCRILSDSTIGDCNIINDGATLTHDNKIGNFNHIAPNASIGGRVTIGDLNLIGTNSSINPDVNIKDKIIVGSGAVVIKNIIEIGTYIGVPCKKK